ncbi:MAG: tRNA pseudouridine(38-40) synthase TruA [SAR202 cluster bacterium]|nr:tRNA pseudouridine(38-40) synthase TruA [SAR202 cluster bacterium]
MSWSARWYFIRLALFIEYDGTSYHGFQIQPKDVTIQEELEKALNKIVNKKIRLDFAGRTDSGVHALSQVIAFNVDENDYISTYVNGMNHYLPDDISVKCCHKVGDDFDPRRDAYSRHYRYTLLLDDSRSPLSRMYSYRITKNVDLSLMRSASKIMLGTHDFKFFSTASKGEYLTTIRTIFSIDINLNDKIIDIDIIGNAFLTSQVRRMVAVLLKIGQGKLFESDLNNMLNLNTERNYSVATLPPQGLCLVEVNYEDFSHEVGEKYGCKN